MDEDELDAATGVASLTPTSEGPPSIDSLGGNSRRFLEHLQTATDALGSSGGFAGNVAAALAGYPNLAVPGLGGSADGGKPSPNSQALFAGFGGTPTGLSFGGLPSPAIGGLPADLGSLDLPSPVARALQAGATHARGVGVGDQPAANANGEGSAEKMMMLGGSGSRLGRGARGGEGDAPSAGEANAKGKLKKELSIEIPVNTLKTIEVQTDGAGGAGGASGGGGESKGPSPGPLTSLLMQGAESMMLSGSGGRGRLDAGAEARRDRAHPADEGDEGKPAAAAAAAATGAGTKRTRSASLSEQTPKRSTRSRRGE